LWRERFEGILVVYLNFLVSSCLVVDSFVVITHVCNSNAVACVYSVFLVEGSVRIGNY
jgi:hypothetical protein